jgi:hypothetical protein
LAITVDGKEQQVEVSDIAEIRRASQAGALASGTTADTVVLNDGKEISGSLVSPVNFSTAAAADGAIVLKNSKEAPILGEVAVTTRRGEKKRVPVADIAYMAREDEKEIIGEEALAYIIRNKGIFSADSWTHSSVANGTRTIEEIRRWTPGSADKPDWIPADTAKLEGYRGPVQNPDSLVYYNMGNKGTRYGGIKMWLELDENKTPINSGIISGQWDFLWGVEGKPNWDTKATFNPNVPNDVPLRLYINSLENPEEVAHLLPDNWREYVEAQPAPVAQPEPVVEAESVVLPGPVVLPEPAVESTPVGDPA